MRAADFPAHMPGIFCACLIGLPPQGHFGERVCAREYRVTAVRVHVSSFACMRRNAGELDERFLRDME